jgi:hypothetical protein
VDLAFLASEEVLEHFLYIHLTHQPQTLLVSVLRRLAGLRVRSLVIAHLEPGSQRAVEPIEGEDVARADFGLELRLGGSEEAFDESAGRRVAYRAVKQPDIQGEAGRSQSMGMIDLGVVEV